MLLLKGTSLEIDASFNIRELPISPVLTLTLDHLNQWLKDLHLTIAKQTNKRKKDLSKYP